MLHYCNTACCGSAAVVPYARVTSRVTSRLLEVLALIRVYTETSYPPCQPALNAGKDRSCARQHVVTRSVTETGCLDLLGA